MRGSTRIAIEVNLGYHENEGFSRDALQGLLSYWTAMGLSPTVAQAVDPDFKTHALDWLKWVENVNQGRMCEVDNDRTHCGLDSPSWEQIVDAWKVGGIPLPTTTLTNPPNPDYGMDAAAWHMKNASNQWVFDFGAAPVAVLALPEGSTNLELKITSIIFRRIWQEKLKTAELTRALLTMDKYARSAYATMSYEAHPKGNPYYQFTQDGVTDQVVSNTFAECSVPHNNDLIADWAWARDPNASGVDWTSKWGHDCIYLINLELWRMTVGTWATE